MRILVADDDEDTVVILNMQLSERGHDVRTARDGAEAVQLAASFQPDVVLLDIGMPGMSGYEAAREIRRQHWGQDMRLIAVSGWDAGQEQGLSDETGFDHHLVKPLDPVALERLVATG